MVRFALIATAWLAYTYSGNLVAAESCRLHMAGDSTMQIVDPNKNPDYGWGQVLPSYARVETAIFNHAKGGRSTKTFLSEERWATLLEGVRADDWVIVQFGHNDASYTKPERYTAPVDFESNLRRMVSDVRARQGRPILITPVVRRHFDTEGKLRDMHGIYPSLVEKVSESTQTPLIDLFSLSSSAVLSAGVLKSIDWFVHIGPGEHPCCPEGRMDNTHFTLEGAHTIASIVVEDIKTQFPESLGACFL